MGRPSVSAFQNGRRPGRPGAGETSTRSAVISSIRHELAPRTNTSPTRDSYTISSSSSPTRVGAPPLAAPERCTAYVPRSGIVPPLVTASRCAPGRPRTVPASRSHTSRGRSSANSSEGYRPDSMSSTPDRAESGSEANGAARRTSAPMPSTGHSSTAAMATICCASTSSGLRGMRSSSMAPARIRSATTVAASRSPRNFGNRTPRETSSTRCPARPTRCRPPATDGGDSTCTTRSTAPMSIPSSRLDVATTQGSRPSLSSVSIRARSLLDTEPWWARATTLPAPLLCPDWPITSAGTGPAGAPAPPRSARPPPRRAPASSFNRAHSRSATRRELQNTIDERCDSTRSRTLSSTCGQIDARPLAAASSDRDGATPASSSVMSSTGTAMRSSRFGACGGATMAAGSGRTPSPPATCPAPPRKEATSSAGRTVADRPMRCAGRSRSASRRSRLSARWAPRFVPASACTSSTITVSTPASPARACDVSTRNSDSGVVIRMSGGAEASARRRRAGVSPVRRPTVISGTGAPRSRAAPRMPDNGARRFRSMSAARAFNGETYSTRQRRVLSSGTGVRASRSSPHRKAASVFPDPVGATTRVFSPSAIASHARVCAGVAPEGNAPPNQARVAGEKRSSPQPGTADPWSFAESILPVCNGGATIPGAGGPAAGGGGVGHRGRSAPDAEAEVTPTGRAPILVGDETFLLLGLYARALR